MDIWHYLYRHGDGILHNEPAPSGQICEAIPLVRKDEAEAEINRYRELCDNQASALKWAKEMIDGRKPVPSGETGPG